VTFKGFALKGVWTWEPGERDRFTAHLRGLKDGHWEIPAPQRLTRAQKANRYYFGVVLKLIHEYTGESVDDIHDFACQRFLPNDLKRIEFCNRMTGEVVQGTVDSRRSSKLTGEDFYVFVESVRDWARVFLNVGTPDPDPEYWRKLAA
jgi:hypothetical protein